MLKRLSVENYALIDKLDIEFAPGLNIITGETGAGKSILLGALGLILGNRVESGVLRDPQRNCVVEAEFDLYGYHLEELFDTLDIDYEEPCLIRRVITSAGKSRAYVNDLPVQLTALRAIGERLIDIHSQHQTLLVGESRFQTTLLDSVAEHLPLLEQYRSVYAELNEVKRQYEDLQREADATSKDREYVAYQLEELQAANLHEGEQEELETLLEELSHAVEIKEILMWTSQMLEGDDEGVLTQLKSAEQSIGRLQSVYPQAEQFYQRLHSALLDLKDLASEVSAEGDRIEVDPVRQEQTQERLDLIYSLQQKHKKDSVSGLLALQAEYAARLNGIDSYEERLAELAQRIGVLQEKASKLAADITNGRKNTAPKIEQYVMEQLARLGMASAQLQVDVHPAGELRADGADVIRFLFTANRNTALQPIEKVASGGEMSRLMLALKALVVSHMQLPTIIFDEIDTGVSGAIADKMGEIVTALGAQLQVINITHLPQVASKGDHHFFVYKEDTPNGTQTRIRELTADERVNEIAKMLSGSAVTQAAVEQARLLLGRKS